MTPSWSATASRCARRTGASPRAADCVVENDSPGATIQDTLINDNRADLTSNLPAFVGDELLDIQSHAAGVLIANRVPSTIERSVFAGNVVTGRAPNAQAIVYDAALQVLDSPLTMRDTLVARNRVEADTLSTEETGPQGTAVELQGGGTLTNVHIVGNSVFARADDGLGGRDGRPRGLRLRGQP